MSCSHNGDIVDRPPQSILTTGNSVEMKSKGNWNKPCEQSELDLTHPAKAQYNELQYYARGKTE